MYTRAHATRNKSARAAAALTSYVGRAARGLAIKSIAHKNLEICDYEGLRKRAYSCGNRPPAGRTDEYEPQKQPARATTARRVTHTQEGHEQSDDYVSLLTNE